ncbi:hypothetical protein BKA66DRAFT_446326 [Pyrenochaeta sp. MPI-SDFR-AT-0127]|nr:hypothetical protein BKA66DRAFT_446326 [Pyrenochaeta sp. MPI-SDFR-AT-0127]
MPDQAPSSPMRPLRYNSNVRHCVIAEAQLYNPMCTTPPFTATCCIKPLHPFSTSIPPQAQGDAGIAPLPHRQLISLSGPDAAKFLQGLITHNVDPELHSSFYSAFLDARGRVLWDVFIWAWPELAAKEGHWACYIEVDEGEVDALKKHLKKHKLRSKIKIAHVEDEGEGGTRVWASWGLADRTLHTNAIIADLDDPRAPSLRRYLARADGEIKADGVESIDAKAYQLQRYKYGIPEGPQEILRESALPMECNVDLSQGIDFKKGCYVGQELTIRTKHTGVVRKRMLPVQLRSSTASYNFPEYGADIKQLDENGCIKKGRAAGKLIAGIGDVGLALCRLEMMTSMKISAEGGSWRPGMEFGIENNGEIIKVKPVLYDWFVLRERELWDKNRTRI